MSIMLAPPPTETTVQYYNELIETISCEQTKKIFKEKSWQ